MADRDMDRVQRSYAVAAAMPKKNLMFSTVDTILHGLSPILHTLMVTLQFASWVFFFGLLPLYLTFQLYMSWREVAWGVIVELTGKFGLEPVHFFVTLAAFVLVHKFLEWRRAEIAEMSIIEGPKKNVCIIGAGVSGIATAKELNEHGHEVICYEKAPQVGGVWAFGVGVGVTKNTMSTSSSIVTSYSDFPAPLTQPNEHKYHISWSQYVDYLKQYMSHFRLHRLIRCNMEVTKTERKGDQWLVTSKNHETGETKTESFDWIVVSSGLHQHKFIPETPGMDKFKKAGGQIHHTDTYRDSEPYRGKRVVLIGAGESGADIVKEISDASPGNVVLALRRGCVVLARDFFGFPPDFHNSRLINLAPAWMRARRDTVGVLVYGDYKRTEWAKWVKALAECSGGDVVSQFATKSENFLESLADGKCELKPNVKEYTDKGVVFEDGSSFECDVVMYCTGYETVFPFLPKGYERHDPRDRLHYMFHPELENCAFIGCARPGLGAIPPLSEMQARYLECILSETRKLPPLEQQRLVIARDKDCSRKNMYVVEKRLPHLISFDHYLNDIAMVCGTAPSTWKVFLLSPTRWWKLLWVPFTTHPFRLYGRGAKPGIPWQVIDELPIPWPDYIPFPVLLARATLFPSIALITQVWQHVPIVGKYVTSTFRPRHPHDV
eukprot:Rmarinus@m.15787